MAEKALMSKFDFDVIYHVLSTTDIGLGIIAPRFIASNIHLYDCGCQPCFLKRDMNGITPLNNPRLAMISTIDGLLDGINESKKKITASRIH
jgi:hypothetical protein